MTATEVHARMALIRQLLGPVYGRLQAEFLQPLVQRCFGLSYRSGALGAAPESIAGQVMSIRYVSPMARAQRLEDVSAMDGYETVLITQTAVDPEAMDGYDWDEARRERAQLMGVPAKLLRDEDDIAALRAKRAEANRIEQQQQMGQQAQASMIDAAAKQMAAA